jgi:hypothetical protein
LWKIEHGEPKSQTDVQTQRGKGRTGEEVMGDKVAVRRK